MSTPSPDLARLHQLVDAASPLPWTVSTDSDNGPPWYWLYSGTPQDRFLYMCDYIDREADAEFICAAREAVPALLAEVERLQRENATLQRELSLVHDRVAREDHRPDCTWWMGGGCGCNCFELEEEDRRAALGETEANE